MIAHKAFAWQNFKYPKVPVFNRIEKTIDEEFQIYLSMLLRNAGINDSRFYNIMEQILYKDGLIAEFLEYANPRTVRTTLKRLSRLSNSPHFSELDLGDATSSLYERMLTEVHKYIPMETYDDKTYVPYTFAQSLEKQIAGIYEPGSKTIKESGKPAVQTLLGKTLEESIAGLPEPELKKPFDDPVQKQVSTSRLKTNIGSQYGCQCKWYEP